MVSWPDILCIWISICHGTHNRRSAPFEKAIHPSTDWLPDGSWQALDILLRPPSTRARTTDLLLCPSSLIPHLLRNPPTHLYNYTMRPFIIWLLVHILPCLLFSEEMNTCHTCNLSSKENL